MVLASLSSQVSFVGCESFPNYGGFACAENVWQTPLQARLTSQQSSQIDERLVGKPNVCSSLRCRSGFSGRMRACMTADLHTHLHA